MTIKIQKLEKEIAEIKGILKDASLKLSRNCGNHLLSASEKQNLWGKLEKLEDELNELLVENGVEINTWDW